MEVRACAAILCFLGLGWLGLIGVAPKPAAPLPQLHALAPLEERFIADPTDPHQAAQLAARYLDLNRPELAIALSRSVGARVLEDPQLSHQLARAYEASDRIPDALATASLALARCARALGSNDVLHVTRVPAHACSERLLAGLERHRNALAHMHDWGVQNDRDPRVALAYRIAERRVSLASYAAQ